MSTDCFDSDETLADTENCLSDITGLTSKPIGGNSESHWGISNI